MRFGPGPKKRSRTFKAGGRSGGWPYENLLVTSQLVRAPGYSVRDAPTIDGPDAAAEMFFGLEDFRQERMYAILLNNRGKVLGIVEASRGSRGQVDFDPPAIFAPAILANATQIVLLHNHPSGDPRLSSDDLVVFERAEEIGELLGFLVLDFIAVGADGTWRSAKGEGVA
jgi:DNA repair protein RadC